MAAAVVLLVSCGGGGGGGGEALTQTFPPVMLPSCRSPARAFKVQLVPRRIAPMTERAFELQLVHDYP